MCEDGSQGEKARRRRASLCGVSDITFAELQKVTSYEELREAHNTAGVFLVKRNGKAHSSMTCSHNELAGQCPVECPHPSPRRRRLRARL